MAGSHRAPVELVKYYFLGVEMDVIGFYTLMRDCQVAKQQICRIAQAIHSRQGQQSTLKADTCGGAPNQSGDNRYQAHSIPPRLP
jgi:hypothetical protein